MLTAKIRMTLERGIMETLLRAGRRRQALSGPARAARRGSLSIEAAAEKGDTEP